VERTICHHNSDDGVDFGADASHDPDRPATFYRVICYRNGTDLSGSITGDGTGFKTGDCEARAGGHKFVRCVAFDNDARGFGGPCTDVPLILHNCTATKNRIANIHVTSHAAHTVVNCISQGATDWDLILSEQTDVSNCNWDESLRRKFDADNGDGVEVKFRGTNPRTTEFLRLQKFSPGIDVGADINVAYNGIAPDWGAFEAQTDYQRDKFSQ